MQEILKRLNRAREWFALLGVLEQLGVVVIIGFIIVVLSGLLVGSIEKSYEIFVDPPSLTLVNESAIQIFFAFILTILGIVVTGFVISILSSSLENTLRDIRGGKLTYVGENHTLIINYNKKLRILLEELNKFHQDNNTVHEVVILINNEEHIELFLDNLKKLNLKHLKVFVRFGNTLSMTRYKELSIYKIHSLIILLNDEIEDVFLKDNQNLQIVNALCGDEDFLNYMLYKRNNEDKPVKAIVEFSTSKYIEKSVSILSKNQIQAIAPKDILNDILNLSIINIEYYNVWSELLSYRGHELYFIPASKFGIDNEHFKDVALQFTQGILLGLSIKIDNQYKLLLNKNDVIISKEDYLIFLAFSFNSIKRDKTVMIPPKITANIPQPKETFVRNILVVGNEKEIHLQEYLDLNKSVIKHIDIDYKEALEKSWFDNHLENDNLDIIIINFDDEHLYRIAILLKTYYDEKTLEKFVFMIDNPQIASHLKNAGLRNTILSQILVSKYISQVSNQITLHFVYKELFSKIDSEINFIEIEELPKKYDDVMQLKKDLINSNITYLGILKNDDSIVFESKDLKDAKKIIVLSDGEF